MVSNLKHKLSKRPPAVPYRTTPYRDGCSNQVEYTEDYTDSVGNKGTKTFCNFTNKKGEEVLGYFLRIKWESSNE